VVEPVIDTLCKRFRILCWESAAIVQGELRGAGTTPDGNHRYHRLLHSLHDAQTFYFDDGAMHG
jgi:hypothetical protein